jgi:Asp/Glu/hydantoin racemase
MRLLVVNPNISESVTALIGKEARRAASPGTEITLATAPFGVAYIETRFEAQIGALAVAEIAARRHRDHDALVVAAFGDPGLPGLKEALGIPVVGMTEAALMSACLLGRRFSIVAISRRITAWYRECVAYNGLLGRLASIRSLEEPLEDVGSVQEDKAQQLKALCRAAAEEDGADVIVVAGAPLAGLARSLKGELPVPVVDGVSSAVCHAETLVRLDPGAARAGSFAPPPLKPNAGLSPALTALLGRGGA